MKFHVITLFPESLRSYREASIISRAEKKELISLKVSNPRDFSENRHNKLDDKPYGGGPGMVMEALPILKAIKNSLSESLFGKVKHFVRDFFSKDKREKTHYVIFSPSGKKFTNEIALKWAQEYEDLVLICGRYEGVDDRVRQILNAEEISIGDYVLTGGELPALVVIDAVSRQIPGVLGNDESREEFRAASPRVFTRPESFKWKGEAYNVPEVLLNGNHKEIEEWRKSQKEN